MNVFIAADGEKTQHELLVLPYGPLGGIPAHLRHLDWRNLATTMTDDKLLGMSPAWVEAAITRNGYALVQSTR
ncbi:hypothetical protein [Devosia sp. A369]